MHTHGSFPAAAMSRLYSPRSSRRRSTTESSPRNAPRASRLPVAAAARFVRCLAPRSCWRRWNARCDGKRRAHKQCESERLISADRRGRSWTRSRDSPRNSASRARIRRGWIKGCSGTKARSRPRLGPRRSIVRREASTGSREERCGRRVGEGRNVLVADGFADPNVGDIVRSLERRDATSRGGDRHLRLSLLRLRAAQSKGENFGGAGCLLSLLSRATRRLRGRF